MGTVSLSICRAASLPEFSAKHWTTENGLPQNSVTAIAQTPEGYLWLGTFGGLVRFDGVTFTVFDTNNTPTLKSNRITALYVDRAGKLWIGTQTCQVYYAERGTFHSFQPFFSDAMANFITMFYEDRQGNFFIGTYKKGFSIFFKEHPLQQTHYDLTANSTENGIRGITEDQAGRVWIAGERQIVEFERGILKTPVFPPIRANSEIVALGGHPLQGLWVITRNHIWHWVKGDWRRYGYFPPTIALDTTIPTTLNDSSWYSFHSDFLYRLQHEQVERIRLPIKIGHRTRALLEDREGNLWMGVDGDGLYQLRRRSITMFETPAISPDISQFAIIQDSSQQVWLGTNSGLFRINGQQVSPFFAGSQRGWQVYSLFQDKAGTLWVGHHDGIAQYQQKKFHLNVIPEARDILSIAQDRYGVMWFGSLGKLIQYKDGVKKIYDEKDGLPHADIRIIYAAQDGALWIGTTAGLSCLRNNIFINYNEKDGLSNSYIRDIYGDEYGSLWIATYGGGLNHFKDGRFTAITTKQGLSDNFVSRILADERGFFWCLGNRGIFSVRRQSLNDFVKGDSKNVLCASYGIADGMSVTEGQGGSQFAGWRMNDGKMWFLLIRGLAIVTPPATTIATVPVLIEQVLVDNVDQSFQSGIKLAPHQNSVEIHYTGLSLTKPEQIQFQYKLDGFDNDWVIAGTRRTVTYNKLPAGDYVFQVRAAIPDAEGKLQTVSFSINVEPAFWQTHTFWALVGIGLVGALFIGYRWRITRLHYRTAQQEIFARQLIASQENERKRIASDMHDGLSQSLVIIKHRALAGLESFSDPEQAKEQLAEIVDASSSALDEVKEIIFALRPHQLDQLGLSAAVSDLADRVAAAHGWQLVKQVDNLDGLFSKENENNIYRIVQEVLNNISKHAAATVVQLISIKKMHYLELIIRDNGHGFIFDEYIDRSPYSLGIHNIIERTKLLGGEVLIQSAPEQGTSLQFKLPINEKRHEKA